MARLSAFLLLPFFAWPAAAQSPLGDWVYTSYIYRGEEVPPSDPHLSMRFSFGADGIDTLAWSRDDYDEYCSRQARYTEQEGQITEIVISVDPKNTPDCASDPNMRTGAETRFTFRAMSGRLEVDADMGSETVTYVWRRAEKLSSVPSE